MHLLSLTLTNLDEMTLEEAKALAMSGRLEGKRTEIISTEEAERRGLLVGWMQDLSLLKDWKDVR